MTELLMNLTPQEIGVATGWLIAIIVGVDIINEDMKHG